MKKLINKPESIVQDMCKGIALAHPQLVLNQKYRILLKKELTPNKVSLISGGGSGHEPAHAGFIGTGMLDAAVCGDVFASPSQIQVYQAIQEAASPKGVLLIIKNYSGDMMNFKNAAYLAQEDGIDVDYVKVDDDIAVQDSLYTVGRRGVAGTVFVHKIAGAAAERGLSLTQVKEIALKTISNVKTLGVALTSCTVPAKGTPTFELGESEMEYGVGIHGEPGISKESIVSAKELADNVITSLCNELKLVDCNNERVAVLVNGFGATPLMELYLLNKEIAREMNHRGINIARSFVGNFMTSIDMAGASVSVLKLDDELEDLLNQPCMTPAFRVDGPVTSVPYNLVQEIADEGEEDVAYGIETPDSYAVIQDTITLSNMLYIVDTMCDVIIRNETFFCELDSHAGDGDFGMSLANGFRQLKREWKTIISQPNLDIATFLNACSLIIMENCGGASGPIWGSAFRAAGKYAAEKQTLTVGEFAKMLQSAMQGIQNTGERSFGRGAVVGDKTLIDALSPCVDAWLEIAREKGDFSNGFRLGTEAAVAGAKKTETFAARMGRAGTVGERSIGYPDAGAHALGVIFIDITNAIQNINNF